jgi:ABC-type transport system involved in multi-copper enzyme maturation permease subunit
MTDRTAESTAQASRDDRTAAIGVGIWILFGIGLLIAFRNASLGASIFVGVGWFGSIICFAPKAVANLFGPVFLYETVRVGRRNLTFIMRTLYLVFLTFILGIVLISWLDSIGALPWRPSGQGIRPGQMAKYGEMAFLTFAPIQYFVIVLLTPAYVAGIIADEKERKTLEFLFATDLKNREIIFGKLAARLVTLMMYIIAGIPLLASLMLFGGIDPELLLAIYAGTILTMIFLASISIYFSTVFKRPRDAIVMSYLFIGALFILTWFLSFLFTSLPFILRGPVVFLGFEIPCHEIGCWIGAVNPAFLVLCWTSLGISADGLAPKFVIVSLILTVLPLGWSILKLRHVATHQSYGVKATKEKNARPLRACGNDPMFWKEVYVDGQRKNGWAAWIAGSVIITLVFAWPILIFCICYYDQNYDFRGWNASSLRDFRSAMSVWLRVATGALSFLMMMGAGTRAASSVCSEKDRDTWISLISTPLDTMSILLGKWWGAILGMRKIFYVLVMVWLLGSVVGAVEPMMLVPALIQLAIYVSFFAWLGIYISCGARKSLIASIRMMLAGIFLSGGFWFFAIFCCFLPLGIMRTNSDPQEIVATLLASFTPPFVMGWMPLEDLDHISPFDPSVRHHIGPWFIILGMFVWSAGSVLMAFLANDSFRRQANRLR